MPFCGPKLSLCCSLLSVWGVLQLGLMGVFFYNKSVALVEDLPLNLSDYEDATDAQLAKFNEDVKRAYIQGAHNCWIAACLYVGTFLISAQQFYMNNRPTSGNAI